MNPSEPGDRGNPHPFSGPGHLRVAARDGHRDFLEEFLELMLVVEALCPTWPARGGFRDTDVFRL
jgi:hypothetical protein